ncbi:MAG: hypothetical protein MRY64_04570 [Hyphomonadaceae bacterium]|nr:hypothetical protein [Hyphomonadaceae bacterium]
MTTSETLPKRSTLLEGISKLCDLARSGEAIRGARVCLVSRSPMSPAAQTVWSVLAPLQEAGVNVYAIFASLDRHHGGERALDQYVAIYGPDLAEKNIRQLHSKLTRKVHEQVIVSEAGVWLGDIVGSGHGAEIADGQYVDFSEGFRGVEHAELARSGFASAFRTARPLSKSGQWYAPERWGKALSAAKNAVVPEAA